MTTAKLALPSTPDPNIPQRQATIPEHDVWVAASAGSGKTKVLTDRVLRLLLPDNDGKYDGADPHRILCITFTKAAAALMALRVQKKLGDWVMMEDGKLRDELRDLLNAEPNDHVISAARKLFSTVLDVPNGLSIMTIHAFCQSTLGRFAIEAGVTPGFKVLEEPRARELLCQIVDDLITGTHHSDQLMGAFGRIATYMDMDKLRDILLGFMAKSREISEFLKKYGTDTKSKLLECLGVDKSLTIDSCFAVFLDALNEDDLRYIVRILIDNGAKTYQDNGRKLADWLALDKKSRQTRMELFEEAIFTKEGTIRSIGKKLESQYSGIPPKIAEAVIPYLLLKDQTAVLRQAEQTSDLLHIVDFCLSRYASRKRDMNALDFNDLILKTRTLLESQQLEWVHYKLDGGIDHILVDEAQDTNIHQWEIIRHLSHDFLSGLGNDKRLRSLFVVGDEKQSIFSFHGADPAAFQSMRSYFSERSQSAGRVFNPVQLETSFRSARPILQLVDTVFGNPDLAQKLGLSEHQKLAHFSYRDKAFGLIELWEPVIKDKIDTRNTEIKWTLPIASDSPSISSASPLAGQIASTIEEWIKKGDILESAGRPIEPRDILVLVRTRTRFVSDLVRQLKVRGIPVSGVDRMKLTDQIAVMDCMALARFARCPQDDLSLACLLRSPFIRMNEDTLMTIALGRTGSLWEALAQKGESHNTIQWLQNVIIASRTEKPFDFFDRILNEICPYQDKISGWKAFATCLGADCIDPLDEFLSYCLAKEEDGVFSLEELIAQLQSSDIEIKRDTEDSDKDSLNQVRIMTVHASKGLESPIVFLPDTMSVPNRGKIDALQWIKSAANTPDIPLWAAKTDDGCAQYHTLRDISYDAMIAENLRLLYVALTRPRDRLYVMGEGSTLNFNDYSWYKLVYDAFQKLPHQKIGSVLRYTAGQPEFSPIADSIIPQNSPSSLPDWARQSVIELDKPRPRIITPSRIESIADKASFPTKQDGQTRFKRGIATHTLFQFLPDLPQTMREQAGRQFLSGMGNDLLPDLQAEILSETLKILNDAVFAEVFGENSLAEVPVSGDMGDGTFINGQIDRLVIGHNQILIVDYKTNRPSPRDENDIPTAYINQLKAYKTAISRIYPDKNIICALLWTDKPLLMPVSV